jgi:hypothetical protein
MSILLQKEDRMGELSGLFDSVQSWLIPVLEEELGELGEKEQEFIMAIELIKPDRFMLRFAWQGVGRPRESRLSVFKAFMVKSVFNYPNTKSLIAGVMGSPKLRRLCGWETIWEVPSESTFSRVFAEFADAEIPSKVHEAVIKANVGAKLVGDVSRDATAIVAREKAAVKETSPKQESRKRGRPKKGEAKQPQDPKRLELQLKRSLEENAADLPKDCSWGCKKGSNGKVESWKGYKLHIDTMDGGTPLSVIMTSASTHDSQVAIPLAQMTAERVTSLYDLMDSAYDAAQIREHSIGLGHVPVIDSNKRRGEKVEFDPAKKERYKIRSTAERVNSELKDNYGGRFVRVRGYAKVFAHLMFGILAITSKQLYALLC